MRPGRSSIRGLALASLLAIIPARAARPRASAQLPGVDATFRAADGWALHARYLAARDQGRQTLVLLHGRGMRKEFWLPLARALRKAGYGYLALDLRGHGQSATGP
ncbi:MAG: alpha/beta fold hydrolase, partial [Elusimicrobia bacterium]|nr:alpha/beta fold hydrolase [Elusimicrobiota bacterium]